MELFLGIAIVPAALLLIHVYRKDRLEHESAGLLIKLLIFGALSAIPASFLEVLGDKYLSGVNNTLVYLFLETFLVVGVAEEGCKFLAARILTWKSREFNCSYDGVVYTVFASMGFAILENILYMYQHGMSVGIARAVTAIPGHCFFAVLMGWGYGNAKKYAVRGDMEMSRSCLRRGFIFAVLGHGAYDFFAMLGSGFSMLLFLALLIALYIIGFKLINKCSLEDVYIVPQETPAVFGLWKCPLCGNENSSSFCPNCGAANPFARQDSQNYRQ